MDLLCAYLFSFFSSQNLCMWFIHKGFSSKVSKCLVCSVLVPGKLLHSLKEAVADLYKTSAVCLVELCNCEVLQGGCS